MGSNSSSTSAPVVTGQALSNSMQPTVQGSRNFWHFWRRGPASSDSQENLDSPLETARGSYLGALTLTSMIIPQPIVATLLTALLAIALSSSGQWSPLLIITVIGLGLGLTLILWLLISFGFIPFTSFDSANATSASHFKRHFSALRSMYKTLMPGQQAPESQELKAFRQAYEVDYQIALESICESLRDARRIVQRGKHRWVEGNGYLSAWQFVHRAEEAMFTVSPRAQVIREAMHDAAAIEGTGIANRDVYLSNLNTAVEVLSHSCAIYLKPLPLLVTANRAESHTLSSNEQVSDELVVQPPQMFLSVKNTQKPINKEVDLEAEMAARSALRYARNILNQYRSGLWDNLMRMRSQLIGTALGTGLLTYCLLGVAICAHIQSSSLLAGLVFYLVGAMSGLFGRLFQESQSDKAIDDYGLTAARVIVTPIISGLAALAGILVVSLLSVNIFNTPGQDIGKGVPLPNLTQIYDLVQNRQGLVVAALFGLTPNRFISMLQQKAEGTKAQLKQSTASQGQSTP